MTGVRPSAARADLALHVRRCPDRRDYQDTWAAMRRFTESRGADTPDEVWLLEHPAVFTLGVAGKPEHLLAPGKIPVVRTDRGGQVTYHGPGQLMVYTLLDLRRRGFGVRRLVELLEEAVIELLAEQRVAAHRRAGAPGVYVQGRKIAALGLRIRRRCSYHGLALNVDLDLEPFGRINPCGYPGLETTRLADLGVGWSVAEAGEHMLGSLSRQLAAG